MRYDPDGFFAGVVAIGGAALIALQAATLLVGSAQYASLGAGCAAAVIVASSLAALRITNPLEVLTASSRAIARGDFSQRVQLASSPISVRLAS